MLILGSVYSAVYRTGLPGGIHGVPQGTVQHPILLIMWISFDTHHGGINMNSRNVEVWREPQSMLYAIRILSSENVVGLSLYRASHFILDYLQD